MLELSTNGIDKNEITRKIEKLEAYIRKAKTRLLSHEQELERVQSQAFGDKEVIETSLKRLRLISKKRSYR